ncbi:MAG TPA: methyltransferase, partial [Candidatus Limnocylindrales bacterium]|nr:methyltransferase [Candidatus Limnocylindrales bacterium]
RGEGWVALQVAAIGLVILAGRVGVPVAIGDASVQGLAGVIGNLLVGAGFLVILLAAAVLGGGGAFTVFPRPIAGGQLVESGPFRFVRHPVYSGLIVASFGSTLARSSLLSLLAAALIFVVLDLKRRREEEWLVERYAGYVAYRSRTKALIPGLY